MKARLLVPILLLLSLQGFGQDTLFFRKKRNPEKKYFIELNKYEVKVIPSKGKRYKAYLVDLRDSTLIMNTRKCDKETRAEVKKLYINFNDSIQRYKLTFAQQDSAYLKLTGQLKSVEYSQNMVCNVTSVKKITVNNYLRADKKKMMGVVNTYAYSALGGILFVGPVLMLISPAFIPVFEFIFIYSIPVVPIALIAETKQINLKRSWKITGKTLHSR